MSLKVSYICNMPTIRKSKPAKWSKPRKQFARRKESNQKFYNSKAWRTTRKLFLQNNPVCVECEKIDILKAADMVDHIKPINEGGAEFDFRNLQPLCHHHHNRKSGREAHKK
jgi:5-methylcytosine-specific restriction protein A